MVGDGFDPVGWSIGRPCFGICELVGTNVLRWVISSSLSGFLPERIEVNPDACYAVDPGVTATRLEHYKTSL